MAKSGGFSLSVKMILTTTLLIVVTVVGSGVLNVINVRKAFDESSQRQIEIFRNGRRALGEFSTPLFARGVSQLLFDRGRDAEILSVVKETVEQDTKDGPAGKKDYGLKLAYVLDLNQKVVAHCFEEATLTCAPGNHEAMSPAIGALADETWKQSLAAWKSSAKGEGMVSFEMTSGGSEYRVFAFPVFAPGPPATAAGALAAEAPEARLGYVVLGYDLAPLKWFTEQAADQKAAASARAALYTGAVG